MHCLAWLTISLAFLCPFQRVQWMVMESVVALEAYILEEIKQTRNDDYRPCHLAEQGVNNNQKRSQAGT